MDDLIAGILFGALGATAVLREVSHRRAAARAAADVAAARARLGEQADMANVGRLITGLANELKSPLQGVIGNTELMLAAEAGSSGSEELRNIRDEARRAAGIVRSLLAFTDTTTLSMRWQDLNQIIARAVDSCRSDLENCGVRAKVAAADRLPLVYVDGRQLERVIGTLLARPVLESALAAGGARDASVTVATRLGPNHILVDVDDLTVAGSADEVAWSADVAACRRVLEAHGGTLEVEPSQKGGFHFHLELPIAAAGAGAIP